MLRYAAIRENEDLPVAQWLCMSRFFVLFLLLVLSRSVSASEAIPFKIIVNTKNPASSITKKGAAMLFTKQLVRWNTGLPAVPVELPSSDPVRRRFSRDVLATDSVRASKGEGAPAEIPLSNVVSFVQENAGAIAYVPVDFPTSGVKVLELQ